MNNVNFATYVDGNTPYVIGDGIIQVTESLKNASDELFCWSTINQMKVNPNKCHLITSGSDEVSMSKTTLKKVGNAKKVQALKLTTN